MSVLRNPIPLPLAELVPPPERFAHPSDLHGPAHVARVLVHAFLLLDLTGHREEAARLWGAVYGHDLARAHDGTCHAHGRGAAVLLARDEGLRAHLARGGVREEDLEAISTAITWHSLPAEIAEGHPHRRLTALLKDADALDRVRFGDLDPRFLRFPGASALVPFAERLLAASRALPPGDFESLWPVAGSLCS